MKNIIQKLNPEKKPLVRAILYVIGCGGFLHLTTLFIVAVTQETPAYFNPFYAVDLDRLFPSIDDSYIVFIIGWGVFAGMIYGMYRLLSKQK